MLIKNRAANGLVAIAASALLAGTLDLEEGGDGASFLVAGC